MKKIILFLFTTLFFVSCSSPLTRTLTLEIPQHPWEIHTGVNLWYSLKYGASSADIRTLYISSSERTVNVEVPTGLTVFFCAYPLGEMQCFGAATGPYDNSNTLKLDPDKGFLANLFLNTQGDAASKVNFELLCNLASQVTPFFTSLDSSRIIQDTLNGNLSKNSITLCPFTQIEPFAVTNGTWVCELSRFGQFTSTGNMTPVLSLPPGVFRFLNYDEELELRITVDSSGSYFQRIRRSLL